MGRKTATSSNLSRLISLRVTPKEFVELVTQTREEGHVSLSAMLRYRLELDADPAPEKNSGKSSSRKTS